MAAALVYAPTILDAAAGPDAALQSILQGAESTGLSIDVPGSPVPLRSRRLHFDRVSTHLEEVGQTALARSTLDFEGQLGSIEVSSLGVERTEFERQGNGWRPRDCLAPRLAAVVGGGGGVLWAFVQRAPVGFVPAPVMVVRGLLWRFWGGAL